MRKSINVKMQVFASLMLFTQFSLAATRMPLDCGTYTGLGRITRNEKGDTLLVIDDKTSSPMELILLGGDLKKRESKLGTTAIAEFYVPKKIANNSKPFVFLKRFLDYAPSLSRSYPLEKTRNQACAIPQQFKIPKF